MLQFDCWAILFSFPAELELSCHKEWLELGGEGVVWSPIPAFKDRRAAVLQKDRIHMSCMFKVFEKIGCAFHSMSYRLRIEELSFFVVYLDSMWNTRKATCSEAV